MRHPHNDRSALVAVGLVVLSFLLMTFDIRSSSQGVAGTLRTGAQNLAGPVQSLLNRVVDPIVDFIDGAANLAGLREENERLRERNRELELRLVEVDSLRNENTSLRELLDLALPDNLQELSIAAEVTGRGGTLDQAFTIDKGTADGVQIGQPAVSAEGALIGVVAEASESSASIVPITSPNAPGIVVQLEDGTRGVVHSTGSGRLVLEVFADDATRVLEGDLLVTFGPYETSTQFPRGLLVGTATESATPVAGTFRVEVEPFVTNIDRVLFVTLIAWPPQDVAPPDEPPEEPPVTDTTEVPADADGGGGDG